MFEGKCRRKHQRHKVSQIDPIQLSSSVGEIYFVFPVDASYSGIGCIYSGKTPPQPGHFYMAGDDRGNREMEVRWVSAIGKNRFRLGLMYKDLKFEES